MIEQLEMFPLGERMVPENTLTKRQIIILALVRLQESSEISKSVKDQAKKIVGEMTKRGER